MSNDHETPAGSENLATPLTDAVKKALWELNPDIHDDMVLLEKKWQDADRQIEEARKDTERLDAILRRDGCMAIEYLRWKEKVYLTNRIDIDAAMQEGECNGSGEPAQENNNE